jgi:hypothetical protein
VQREAGLQHPVVEHQGVQHVVAVQPRMLDVAAVSVSAMQRR